MVKKFKVFIPGGTVVPIIALDYEILWEEAGATLRFYSFNGDKLAVFIPGGWYGLQDIDVTNGKTVT